MCILLIQKILYLEQISNWSLKKWFWIFQKLTISNCNCNAWPMLFHIKINIASWYISSIFCKMYSSISGFVCYNMWVWLYWTVWYIFIYMNIWIILKNEWFWIYSFICRFMFQMCRQSTLGLFVYTILKIIFSSQYLIFLLYFCAYGDSQ